jgi:ketosteroid isomerase-like protein
MTSSRWCDAGRSQLLPIAEPAVVGRAAIAREWAKVYGIPGFRNPAQITRLDVAGSGDLGITQGTYEATMTGADGRPPVEGGKWVTVWRRDVDGQRRVTTDIANTDARPPTMRKRPSAATELGSELTRSSRALPAPEANE